MKDKRFLVRNLWVRMLSSENKKLMLMKDDFRHLSFVLLCTHTSNIYTREKWPVIVSGKIFNTAKAPKMPSVAKLSLSLFEKLPFPPNWLVKIPTVTLDYVLLS